MRNWLPVEERFAAKVRIGAPDACWPWMGVRNRGYGRLKHQGQFISAHRFAWTQAFGPIPEGLHVCHHCDNPPCCNPAHLFLGTQADNTHDRHAKGRSRGPRGERHASHKLTPAQVVEIRRLTSGPNPPSYSELARRYGLTPQGLRFVALGKTWKESA